MCAFFFAATLGCCSDRRKSVGPSAPIAYATSVSPPNEAIAWPGCRYPMDDKAAAWPGRGYQMGNKAVAWLSFRCWVLDDAVSSQGRRCWVANDAAAWPRCRCWMASAAAGCPRRSSCKSPRARILVLGTSGAHWPARWPRFELTERVDKS